ncbi:hypothetical protein MRX96_019051 [Rhipicephalus microplus]
MEPIKMPDRLLLRLMLRFRPQIIHPNFPTEHPPADFGWPQQPPALIFLSKQRDRQRRRNGVAEQPAGRSRDRQEQHTLVSAHHCTRHWSWWYMRGKKRKKNTFKTKQEWKSERQRARG